MFAPSALTCIIAGNGVEIKISHRSASVVRERQFRLVAGRRDIQTAVNKDQEAKTDFVCGLESFGLAIAGALSLAYLGFARLIGLAYSGRKMFIQSYQRVINGNLPNSTQLYCLVIIVFVVTGYLVLGMVPVVLTSARSLLMNRIKDHSRGAPVDVFRQRPTTIRIDTGSSIDTIPSESLPENYTNIQRIILSNARSNKKK